MFKHSEKTNFKIKTLNFHGRRLLLQYTNIPLQTIISKFKNYLKVKLFIKLFIHKKTHKLFNLIQKK